MGANRDISKLGPLPTTVGGAFVWTTAGWSQVTKANVGLANVDNTADSAKPVSVAQQAALDAKAPLNQPTFNGPATSILSQNAFRAQAPVGQPQTGISLFIPSADADRKTFEWLALNDSAPRLVFRTINDAYSAGTEFLTAYRASSGHGMDRIAMRGVNLVVGQDAQLDTVARLQVVGAGVMTGPVKVGQYTLATLPSAAAFNGYEIDVTNATASPAGPKRCRSNGTNWLILNTNTPVS